MTPAHPLRAVSVAVAVAAVILALTTGCEGSTGSTSDPTSAMEPRWALAEVPALPVADDLADRLEQAVPVAADAPSGLSITVLSGRHGEWSYEAGSSDGVTPLEPDAVFALASLTKTFVAAAVLALVAGGAVGLDDPIADHLPGALEFDAAGTTVRQHLSMTAGIPDPPDVIPDPAQIIPPQDVLDLVATARPDPGTFAYSNFSYFLLSLLLENEASGSWAQALREQVVPAAEFPRIAFQPEESPLPPLAMPVHGGAISAEVAAYGNGLLTSPAFASRMKGEGAAAGPADEVARWWFRLFHGELVDAASLAHMTTGDGDDYGMGVFLVDPVEGHDAFANGGWGDPGSTFVLAVPDEELVVAALLNSGGDPDSFVRPLAEELAAILIE